MQSNSHVLRPVVWSLMSSDLTIVFIVRLLFLFVIIHVYHHLLFDEFAPSVAKMKKFWAKHRVFVPASAHQLISSKNNHM